MDTLLSFLTTLFTFFVQFVTLAIDFFIWLLSALLHFVQSL